MLDDLVVAVLDIELSAIERRMIEFGRGNLVHELRHAVQTAEAASFKAVVERATGRRVVAFASHTHVNPAFVAELFRLGPSDRTPGRTRRARVSEGAAMAGARDWASRTGRPRSRRAQGR